MSNVKVEPLAARSGRDVFGAKDSVSMVRLGVLPTAEERRLFERAVKQDRMAEDLLRRSYEGRPNGSLWLDLQLAERDGWETGIYMKHLDAHRGDTMRIHMVSWQKDGQAVVQLEVNGRVTDVRHVKLDGKEQVLEYPVGNEEGIVLWKVASVWHGEPSDVAISYFVGPQASHYAKRFVDYFSYM